MTDEFVVPAVIGDYEGMKDGDGILCFNFRADRVREMLAALLEPKFDGFPRKRVIKFAAAAGMTRYSDELAPFLGVLFPQDKLDHILGEVVAEAGRSPAPHRGDREIPPRHLLPERRPGERVSRRGPHHGPLAEGRHLRPAAGDVGAGTHRQGRGGDRLAASTT